MCPTGRLNPLRLPGTPELTMVTGVLPHHIARTCSGFVVPSRKLRGTGVPVKETSKLGYQFR